MILESFNLTTAMKRFFAPIITLAMLVAGCAKENTEITAPECAQTITVEVADDATRTHIDGQTIKWNETGEQLTIIYFADESTTRRQSATHEEYSLVDNRATFTADFTPTDGATKYTFGAFYPYAYKSITSSVTLTTLQEQTPLADSYDPAGDILVSKEPIVTDSTPDKVSFLFSRMVALVRMTIEGIGQGEKIESIVFSSPAKPAGSVTVKVHEGATVENAVWYNNYEDITLHMNGLEATGEETVWFTTIPTDLSGTSFTVKVTTDKYDYIKEVDLTNKTLKFERANIATFTVSGLSIVEKPKAYQLLTDVAELNAGDKVIIANRNSASSSARFLSVNPYDSTKINVVSSMTITNDVEILETSLTSDVAVFTLEEGSTPGTFAFKDATAGYLCGTYDAENWTSALYYSPTLEAGASWSVELINNGAKMGSYYDGTSVRYLNNYDNYKFNYATSRGSSYHYYIFYMDGQSSEEPETPGQVVVPLDEPVATAKVDGNTVIVEWTAVEGAKDYTVVCGEQSVTVATTTATFENVAAGQYKVFVTANPADETRHVASTSNRVEVIVEDTPAEESESLTFDFKGHSNASASTVGTIYEGDIVVYSSGSWRTNNADGRDCIYIGRTTSNELRVEAQNGKVITKITMTAPIGYVIDLKGKEYDGYTTTTFASTTTLEWTKECSKVVFTPAGSSHSNIETITVEYR